MAVFVSVHVLLARPPLRARLVGVLGGPIYLIAYSAVSVVLLTWVVRALLHAPRMFLWGTPSWAYPFAICGSLLAFCLLGVGAALPNPLSVSLRSPTVYDPKRPGPLGWIRHPLLWGFSAWGVAHVPANGDWPSLILFLGAAVFGVVGAAAVERRRRRQLGADTWAHLTPGRGHWNQPATLGLACAVALWLLTALWGHQTLFSVDPLATLGIP